MKDFMTGIYNLYYFFKVIWRFRWYDPSYDFAVMHKIYRYKADKWKDSHYVGNETDLKKLQTIANYFKNIIY